MADHRENPDGTLERLIRILSAFEASQPRLTVTALAARAEIPVPTTYRWVVRLVDAGLLRRHDDSTIGPGLKLWELAARSAPTSSLSSVAMPFLDDVQSVLRQHTQLAVLDAEGVLILERLSARGAVANQAMVAGRLPTLTTSLGRVLLAYSPKHVTEKFIANHRTELGQPIAPPISAVTGEPGSARGVTNPTEEQLRAELSRARQQGYASVHGHIDVETTGVSVPIKLPDPGMELTSGSTKSTVAALGTVVPRHSELAPGLAPMLMASARAISRSLDAQQTQIHEFINE